ncbi:unnamed protein product [Rotaria sordida]|uniref:Uncharacterized protein n=1 Tax=Rotaria sordida TaxID=392033 RepID=A0A816A1A2_9BILA|nr:unnamed protein product [Rotaria sordida]CAF1589187.1 unnamed protein product [Rotaria sordida]
MSPSQAKQCIVYNKLEEVKQSEVTKSVPIPPPIPQKELIQQESSICSLETPFDPLAIDMTSSSTLSQTAQIPETIVRRPVVNSRRRAAAKVRSALPPSPSSQQQQQQTADQPLPVPAFASENFSFDNKIDNAGDLFAAASSFAPGFGAAPAAAPSLLLSPLSTKTSSLLCHQFEQAPAMSSTTGEGKT